MHMVESFRPVHLCLALWRNGLIFSVPVPTVSWRQLLSGLLDALVCICSLGSKSDQT